MGELGKTPILCYCCTAGNRVTVYRLPCSMVDEIGWEEDRLGTPRKCIVRMGVGWKRIVYQSLVAVLENGIQNEI